MKVIKRLAGIFAVAVLVALAVLFVSAGKAEAAEGDTYPIRMNYYMYDSVLRIIPNPSCSNSTILFTNDNGHYYSDESTNPHEGDTVTLAIGSGTTIYWIDSIEIHYALPGQLVS